MYPGRVAHFRGSYPSATRQSLSPRPPAARRTGRGTLRTSLRPGRRQGGGTLGLPVARPGRHAGRRSARRGDAIIDRPRRRSSSAASRGLGIWKKAPSPPSPDTRAWAPLPRIGATASRSRCASTPAIAAAAAIVDPTCLMETAGRESGFDPTPSRRPQARAATSSSSTRPGWFQRPDRGRAQGALRLVRVADPRPEYPAAWPLPASSIAPEPRARCPSLLSLP